MPVATACCGGHFVTAEWQVGDYEGTLGRAGDGPAEGKEFVHRNRQARLVAEYIVGRRVANEEHFNT